MKSKQVDHPGRIFAKYIVEKSGMSQSAVARALGFNQPQPVNELVNEKRAITPKMALLIERFSNGEYPAEYWLELQMEWDLADAKETLSPQRLGMVIPFTGKLS